MKFKVGSHVIVSPSVGDIKEPGFTLGPGETVTKEHIIEVPAGSGPPKFDMQLDGDCPCGGKMVKHEVGPGELLFKCNKRWKFWRKHSDLGVSFEVTKVASNVPPNNVPQGKKYDVN